jgi:RNA polymerase sigma-70 factor, ECF subfamily
MSPITADPRAQIVSLLPRLRRFARGLTPDSHLADDLVQAACLKALERWHQWQPGTSLASWLFRIVQNTWIDEFRSRARQATDPDEDALLELPGEDGRAVVERRSELRAVRQAMAALPEEQRAVLLLVTVDGLSYQEAADALGVPMGTVMSRLARARARLADAIGGH